MTLKRQVAAWGNLNHTYASRGYRSIPDTGNIQETVRQKLAFKDSVTITIHKAADQKLAFKPAATPRIGRRILRSVTQKLAIKDDHDEQFRRARSVEQKVGVKDAVTKKTYESVTQKVAFKPRAAMVLLGFVVKVTQKLRFKTDTEERFTRKISADQKLAFKSTVTRTAHVTEEQKLAIKTTATMRSLLVIAVQQKLRFKDGYATIFHRAISVSQGLRFKTTAVKHTFEKVTQKVSWHEVGADKVRIRYRDVEQKLAFKDSYITKLTIMAVQGLRIDDRGFIKLFRDVTDGLAIKPDAGKVSRLFRTAPQTLGIKGTAKTISSLYRTVQQKVGFNHEVHLAQKFANITKSAYHIFRFRDRKVRQNRAPVDPFSYKGTSTRKAISRIFREIDRTTRYRT